MKIPTILLITLFALFQGNFISPAQAQGNIQAQFNEGVKLYNNGKYTDALLIFETILEQKADYVYARSYSAKCKTMIAQGAGPKNDLEGQISRILLPQVGFSDAPIGDVLDYLSARATELSGGSVVANFIFKGTPEQRQNILITLNVRNIPMNEAVRYVGQLANMRVKYEEHAIIIDPQLTVPAGDAPAVEPSGTPAPASPAPTSNPFK
ncbi:MAG: hypothetical protein KA250_13915 [Verrucomicrobiales bacterium]|jgi:hypothetical protein|nr:hypothetical protein [Verrucomicrobiales bacterium]HQZ28953.1 hypothetical protein [Verrucomicrobiales bacterium]